MGSLKNIKNYEVNPSIEKLREYLKYSTQTIGGRILERYRDEDGMEVTRRDESYLKSKFVDTGRFFKIFDHTIEDVRNLSNGAKDMFYFITHKVVKRFALSSVKIDWDEYQKYSVKKSRASYYSSLKELLDKEFIYRKANSDNVFFINVTKFYNGDRGSLYEKHFGYDLSDNTPNPEWEELNEFLKTREKEENDNIHNQE